MTRKITDLDTETGLPRKLGWQILRWITPVLLGVAVWYTAETKRRIANMEKSQADMRLEVAIRLTRIESKLHILAVTPANLDATDESEAVQ